MRARITGAVKGAVVTLCFHGQATAGEFLQLAKLKNKYSERLTHALNERLVGILSRRICRHLFALNLTTVDSHLG
jgi:hypothetical protein